MSAVLVESGPDQGAPWHFGQPFKEQQALLDGRAFVDLSHLSEKEMRVGVIQPFF